MLINFDFNQINKNLPKNIYGVRIFDVDKNKYVMQIDSTDRLINKIPKIEAHLKGIRHKAFSVLIFNNDGKMLIQKRAKIKYHSGSVSRFSTK